MEKLEQMGLKWINPISMKDVERFVDRYDTEVKSVGNRKEITKSEIMECLELDNYPRFEVIDKDKFSSYYEGIKFKEAPDYVWNCLYFTPSITGERIQMVMETIEKVDSQIIKAYKKENQSLMNMVEGLKIKMLFDEKKTKRELRRKVGDLMIVLVNEFSCKENQKQSYNEIKNELVDKIKRGEKFENK